MTRAEKVAEAQRFRAQGWKLPEIAERMAAKPATVRAWLADPDLSKQRARRARYSRPCADCGRPTNGSGGYAVQHKRCAECSHVHQYATRRWTPENIAAAIRDWANAHGRSPSASEWVAGDETHPSTSTVAYAMGWNEAIRVAGYEPAFDFDRPAQRDPSIRERAAQMYRDGASGKEIATEFGVTTGAVYGWLDAVGQPRRTRSEVYRLRFGCAG